MGSVESVEMDGSELAKFLDRGGTGVLSLAKENIPYSIPISYGYNPVAKEFYFRLGFHKTSEKLSFVDASAQARLVTYARVDGVWKSVIAVGPLSQISDDELTDDIVSSLRQSDLPLFNIWDEPMSAIEFELYRFESDRLTGRKEVASGRNE